ncbi:MAG: diguanylate cyclase [Acidobacteria bacterium]|nr:diguanylate cyclase [Acidobacteriota bacterium]
MKPDSLILRQYLDNLFEGAYAVDMNRRIVYWNTAAEKITGFSADEVLGSCCADNILQHVNGSGVSLCRHDCPLAQTIRDGQNREVEVFLHHKLGHRLPVRVRTSILRDEQGGIVGALELFNERMGRESLQRRVRDLEKMAYLDPLTGLANRRYIEAALDQRFHEVRRFGWSFGFIMADVDHFKEINDRYGHEMGDRMLQMVGRTLSSSSRPYDIIGRWGGEEFVGLLLHLDEVTLTEIAQRLRIMVQNSFLILDGEKLSVTLSMGCTLARSDDSVKKILQRADRLLYRCKNGGRNCVVIG